MANKNYSPTPEEKQLFARRKVCVRRVPPRVELRARVCRKLIEQLGKPLNKNVDLRFDASEDEMKMGTPVIENDGDGNETCRPQTDRELHTMRVVIVSFNYLDVRGTVFGQLARICREQALELLLAAERFESPPEHMTIGYAMERAQNSRGGKAVRKQRTVKVA
jgi:hypothetical protein